MAQNSITVNLADFEEQCAKGLVAFTRLDVDLYQLAYKRFKRDTGERDRPDIMQVNRAAMATLVVELLAENDRLRAQIARNELALRVLGEVIPAAMDRLDAEAAPAEEALSAAVAAIQSTTAPEG